MTTRYSVAIDEHGEGHITITENGEVETFDSSDRLFPAILKAATVDHLSLDEIRELEVDNTVTDIVDLTDRVTLEGDTVYLDGEPAPRTLSDTIVRYRNEGRPFQGLVKFLERLDNNPSRRSREQLFNWTSRVDLEIDGEGYLIGYKGVQSDLHSSGSGGAEVDGVWIDGRVPNQEGSVISMPREKVQDDPNITCSYGLHVGNKQYATSFGPVTLTVRVDPADVVSVPTDYNGQKMRCCRYEVLEVIIPDEPEYDYEPAWAESEEVYEALEEVVPKSFLDKLRRTFKA